MNNKKETPIVGAIGVYKSDESRSVTITEPFGNLNAPFRVLFDVAQKYKDSDYYTKVDSIIDKSFDKGLSFDELKALIKCDPFTTYWIIQSMIAEGLLKEIITTPKKGCPMLGGYGYVTYSSTMVSIARKYRLLTDKEKGGCE